MEALDWFMEVLGLLIEMPLDWFTETSADWFTETWLDR